MATNLGELSLQLKLDRREFDREIRRLRSDRDINDITIEPKVQTRSLRDLSDVFSTLKRQFRDGLKLNLHIEGDSIRNIGSHWSRTSSEIIDSIHSLESQSRGIGQQIQRNLSEGSPGITRNIRIYWQTTISDIIRNLASLTQRSAQTGQQIQSNIDNISLASLVFPQGLRSSVDDFIGSLRTVLAIDLNDLVGSLYEIAEGSITAFMAFQKLETALDFVSNSDVPETLKYLGEEANRLGVEVSSLSQNYVAFAQATRDTPLEMNTEEMFSGFSQALATLNTGADEASEAFNILGSMISAGTVEHDRLAEDVGEVFPMAFGAAARAMGMTQRKFKELLDSGNVLSKDLLPKLATQLELESADAAAKSTESFTTAVVGLNNRFSSINVGIGDFVSQAVHPLINSLNSLLDILGKNKEFLAGLIGAAAVTPVLGYIGTLGALQASLGGVTGALATAKAAALTFGKVLVKTAASLGSFLVIAGGIAAITQAFRLSTTEAEKFGDRASARLDELKDKTNALAVSIEGMSNEFTIGGPLGWIDEARSRIGHDRAFAGFKESSIKSDAEDTLRQYDKILQVTGAVVGNKERLNYLQEQLIANTEKQQQVEAEIAGEEIAKKPDQDKIQELRQEQASLIKQRKAFIDNAVPGGTKALEDQLNNLKQFRDYLKDMKTQGAEVGPALSSVESQIKIATNQMETFKDTIESANAEVKILSNLFKEIESSRATEEFNIDLQNTKAQTQVNQQYLSGEISYEEREKKLEDLELRHSKRRLQSLKQFQNQYRAVFEELSEAESSQIESLLSGKSLGDATLGELQRVQEKLPDAVSGNVKQVLKYRQQVIETQQEIAELEVEVSEKKAEQLHDEQENAKELLDGTTKVSSSLKDRKKHLDKFISEVQQVQELESDISEKAIDLQESHRGLIRDLEKDFQQNKDEIEKQRRSLSQSQFRSSFLGLTSSTESVGFDINQTLADFESSVDAFKDSQENTALTRLEVEEQNLEISKNIRSLQEKSERLSKLRVEHQDAIRQLQLEFGVKQGQSWEKLLSALEAQKQGFVKIGEGVVKGGNSLVKAIQAVANNLTSASKQIQAPSGGTTGSIGGDIGAQLFEAIIGKESGGNPQAVNADTGALGLGQVMPSNVASWTQQALGQSLSPQQFLQDKQAQIDTIEHKLSQYYSEALEKAGGNQEEAIRRVASRWYSGQGDLFDYESNEGKYPSIRDYSLDILQRVLDSAGGSLDASPIKDNVQRSLSDIVFPVVGRNANQNLPGPGGMLDARRIRGGRNEVHGGIDYMYGTGTPLQAPISGQVSSVYSDRGEYGVRVRGKNQQGQTVEIALNHLASIAQDIRQGQQVQAGQSLGTVGGDKGSWGSTGAHLDLKVKIGGQYVDPRDFFGGKSGGTGGGPAKSLGISPISIPEINYQDILSDVGLSGSGGTSGLPSLDFSNLESLQSRAIASNTELSDLEREVEQQERLNEIREQGLEISSKSEGLVDQRQELARSTDELLSKTDQLLVSGKGYLTFQEQLNEVQQSTTKQIESQRRSLVELKDKLDTAASGFDELGGTAEERSKAIADKLREVQEATGEDLSTEIQNVLDYPAQAAETVELIRQKSDEASQALQQLSENESRIVQTAIARKADELRSAASSTVSQLKQALLQSQNEITDNVFDSAELSKQASLISEDISFAKEQQQAQEFLEQNSALLERMGISAQHYRDMLSQAHKNRQQSIEQEYQTRIEEANRELQNRSRTSSISVIESRAGALRNDPFQQNQLRGLSKTLQANLDFQKQLTELDELRDKFGQNNEQLLKFEKNLRKVHQIKLDSIAHDADFIGSKFEEITKSSLNTFFTSIFQNTKSVGDAFSSLAQNILKQIGAIAAKLATNAVVGKIFGGSAGGVTGGTPPLSNGSNGGGSSGGGGGGFLQSAVQLGGTLLSAALYEGGPVPNYANTSLVPGGGSKNQIDDAMQREKSAGGDPRLIVASVGEQVLSNKRVGGLSDAEAFRSLQASGMWDSLKSGVRKKKPNFFRQSQLYASISESSKRDRLRQDAFLDKLSGARSLSRSQGSSFNYYYGGSVGSSISNTPATNILRSLSEGGSILSRDFTPTYYYGGPVLSKTPSNSLVEASHFFSGGSISKNSLTYQMPSSPSTNIRNFATGGTVFSPSSIVPDRSSQGSTQVFNSNININVPSEDNEGFRQMSSRLARDTHERQKRAFKRQT